MSKLKNLAGITILAALLAAAAACSRTDPTDATVNAPANISATNTAQPANVAATPGSATAGVLSSPSATYRAAYNARKEKDIPTLKRVMSTEMLAFLTDMGQSNDKKKLNLDQVLEELCKQPQAPNGDIRNENVDGDHATLEYQDEKGKWEPMDFVKENGEWKLTLPKRMKDPGDIRQEKK